jgi:hypothetical protein
MIVPRKLRIAGIVLAVLLLLYVLLGFFAVPSIVRRNGSASWHWAKSPSIPSR